MKRSRQGSEESTSSKYSIQEPQTMEDESIEKKTFAFEFNDIPMDLVFSDDEETSDETSNHIDKKDQTSPTVQKDFKWIAELEKSSVIQIRLQVEKGTATLILDFGQHIHSFLSVFISFIDTSDEGAPSLKLLPYSFSAMFTVKTAENVRDELVRSGLKYGLSKDQVLSLGVISDGGTNVSSMGKKYFANWSLCSCHALQKMSERLLAPKKSNMFLYTKEEIMKLEECQLLLQLCAKMSLLIHKYKKELRLQKLPTVYIETRWQSSVRCARDIEKLIPLLKTNNISKIAELANEIDVKRSELRTCIETLEKFDPLVSFFEVETSTTIQLYLPFVQDINTQYGQGEYEADEELTRILNKSGRIVTGDYLENKISDIHLKATILTPRLKKMTKLSNSHKKEALDVVTKSFEEFKEKSAQKSNCIAQVDPPSKKKKYQFLFDEEDDTIDELEFYLKEKVLESTPECPLQYWCSKRNEYPLLSQMAYGVFSALSSESICERAFSAVKRVIRDDRHRLDPTFMESVMVAYFYSNQFK
ncbi:unnamed protein product [Caenorhabditis nigoni]